MITVIRLKLLNDKENKDVHVNVDAIDAIYRDTKNTYGVLMRSGVCYHIDQEWYKILMRVLELK